MPSTLGTPLISYLFSFAKATNQFYDFLFTDELKSVWGGGEEGGNRYKKEGGVKKTFLLEL